MVLYYNRSRVSQLSPGTANRQQYSALRLVLLSEGLDVERTLRTEELSGDVQGLASHNDNLLAVEELLGHSAG